MLPQTRANSPSPQHTEKYVTSHTFVVAGSSFTVCSFKQQASMTRMHIFHNQLLFISSTTNTVPQIYAPVSSSQTILPKHFRRLFFIFKLRLWNVSSIITKLPEINCTMSISIWCRRLNAFASDNKLWKCNYLMKGTYYHI